MPQHTAMQKLTAALINVKQSPDFNPRALPPIYLAPYLHERLENFEAKLTTALAVENTGTIFFTIPEQRQIKVTNYGKLLSKICSSPIEPRTPAKKRTHGHADSDTNSASPADSPPSNYSHSSNSSSSSDLGASPLVKRLASSSSASAAVASAAGKAKKQPAAAATVGAANPATFFSTDEIRLKLAAVQKQRQANEVKANELKILRQRREAAQALLNLEVQRLDEKTNAETLELQIQTERDKIDELEELHKLTKKETARVGVVSAAGTRKIAPLAAAAAAPAPEEPPKSPSHHHPHRR